MEIHFHSDSKSSPGIKTINLGEKEGFSRLSQMPAWSSREAAGHLVRP